MPIPLAAALIGGGLVAGAAGGIMGGMAQNRAGRKARDWYNDRTNENRSGLLNAYYGQFLDQRGQYLPGFSAENDPRYARPIQGALGSITNQLGKQYGQIRRGYEKREQQTLAGLGGLQSLASAYGAGANQIIDEEMKRGLESANRSSSAKYSAMGLGASTMGANAAAQNARRFAFEGAKAKVGIASERNSRMADAMKYGTGMRATLGSQWANLRTQQANTMESLRRQNQMTSLGLLQSQVVNPWLGSNPSAFYPGQSGGGNALGQVGGVLSGLGGMALAGGLGNNNLFGGADLPGAYTTTMRGNPSLSQPFGLWDSRRTG